MRVSGARCVTTRSATRMLVWPVDSSAYPPTRPSTPGLGRVPAVYGWTRCGVPETKILLHHATMIVGAGMTAAMRKMSGSGV